MLSGMRRALFVISTRHKLGMTMHICTPSAPEEFKVILGFIGIWRPNWDTGWLPQIIKLNKMMFILSKLDWR